MKCTRCGNEIKVKDAKFCPFCGGTIEKQEELAGYTRGQFFSYTGDSEFREAWEAVKEMTADDALAWFREHPPTHFVYRFVGEWVGEHRGRKRARAGAILRDSVKYYCSPEEKVTAKMYRLTCGLLSGIGKDAFWTKEECEAAIREELENVKKDS